MIRLGLVVCSLLSTAVALADDAGTPPEDAFFTEGGGIVAHYHFSGPVTPRTSAWIRRDGRVLSRGVRNPIEAELGSLDGNARPGLPWREGQVDVALVKKIEKAARASGLCKAKSTPGFSVGGAWLLVIDLGPGLRCAYRRRAHLDVDRPIARLRDAVTSALDAAGAAPALHEGVRASAWELGPLAPPL